jgi:hypothetical protein
MPMYRVRVADRNAYRDAVVKRFDQLRRVLSLDEHIDILSRIPPGDAVAFIHGEYGDACRTCGDVSDVLCDFPVADGKTCDAPLCERCTPESAPDVHYCPGHRAEFEAFRDAGGVKDKLENLVPFARLRRGRR